MSDTEQKKISPQALYTLLYCAMPKVPFTSMLTNDAKSGLAADLASEVLRQIGLDLDGKPLSR